MPPEKGVTQINKIDNAVPLSIVRCGSPNRIARPANSEPRPLVISMAANRMPIDVTVSPNPTERLLDALGAGASTWTEFADDSPLEQAGFEPSVPLQRGVGSTFANRTSSLSDLEQS